MVRIQTDRPNTSGRREISAPNGELPSDPQQGQTGTTRHRSYAKSPVAIHRPSAWSGLKALRNRSPAKRQAAKLCYRFGPLTPSARSAKLIAGDGTENGFPAPNKELVTNPKQLLDRKSPIQVRIYFPPPASHVSEPGSSLQPHRPPRCTVKPYAAQYSGRTRSATGCEVCDCGFENRLPQRAIAKSLGLSRGAISAYLSRARCCRRWLGDTRGTRRCKAQGAAVSTERGTSANQWPMPDWACL
jgi:hypothetical protein